jgi:hypothetical protein
MSDLDCILVFGVWEEALDCLETMGEQLLVEGQRSVSTARYIPREEGRINVPPKEVRTKGSAERGTLKDVRRWPFLKCRAFFFGR